MQLLMIITEKYYVHLPMTLLYQFAINFAQMASYYQCIGTKDSLSYVLQNKLYPICVGAISMTSLQCVAWVSVTYLNDKIKLILCQLQVAKFSMRAIVNHLNEALIVRTEDGQLSYSNDLGIRIFEKACEDVFRNQSSMHRYLNRLKSMDFLSFNFWAKDKIVNS